MQLILVLVVSKFNYDITNSNLWSEVIQLKLRQGFGRMGRSPGNKFLPPSEDARNEDIPENAS